MLMNYDGSIRIGTELDTQKFEKQIQDVERKLETQKAALNAISKSKPYENQNESIKKYGVEIEKTTNKLNKLKNMQFAVSLKGAKNIQYDQHSLFSQSLSINKGSIGNKANGINTGNLAFVAENVKDLKNAFPEAEKSGVKAGTNVNKSFSKSTTTLKRFALSLFGLGSIFAMVSKASSAYLSQNTELANKLQSVWVGLGSFLAPLIEWLSDVLLKGLGYLNEFIKALTGIDFIANANAKAIQKQANAQKELNRQTYSFDEMNIAHDSSSSSSSSSGLSGLVNLPELDQGIIVKLQNLAYWLKENWDWISKVGIVFGVVFGASKMAGWLRNISSLIGGSGTGLIGVATALKGLATIGVVAVGVNFLYDTVTGRNLIDDLATISGYVKEYLSDSGSLNEQGKNAIDNTKKYVEETNKLVDAKHKEALAGNSTSHELQLYLSYLDQTIKSAEQTAEKERELAKTVRMGSDAWEGYNRSATAYENLARDLRERMRELYEAGLLDEEQKLRYLPLWERWNVVLEIFQKDVANGTNELGKLNEKIHGNKNSIQSFIDKAKELGNNLANMAKKDYTIKQTVKTEFSAPDTSKFQNALKKLGISSTSVLGGALGVALSSIKLASGGIINNPGRGVPIGGNIVGGEAGREAVLPLTDPGTMAELGYEIGKHITVNTTLNNYMNSRLIQREIIKSTKDKEFATNGG